MSLRAINRQTWSLEHNMLKSATMLTGSSQFHQRLLKKIFSHRFIYVKERHIFSLFKVLESLEYAEVKTLPCSLHRHGHHNGSRKQHHHKLYIEGPFHWVLKEKERQRLWDSLFEDWIHNSTASASSTLVSFQALDAHSCFWKTQLESMLSEKQHW